VTEIKISLAALDYIRAHGGRLFVDAAGAATEPPRDGVYARQPAQGIELVLPQDVPRAGRLRVELRELPEPHLVVYNDDLQG
jgi:hypothetical protein